MYTSTRYAKKEVSADTFGGNAADTVIQYIKEEIVFTQVSEGITLSGQDGQWAIVATSNPLYQEGTGNPLELPLQAGVTLFNSESEWREDRRLARQALLDNIDQSAQEATNSILSPEEKGYPAFTSADKAFLAARYYRTSKRWEDTRTWFKATYGFDAVDYHEGN